MSAKTEISYPAHGNSSCAQVEDHSFWFKHRNECISALVRQFSPAGTFADIGGGNGFVARQLQDDGHEITLIEPGPDGARHARERGIRHVICSSLEQLDGAKHIYDAIGAFDVVEHISDDADFIRRLSQLLAPSGYFFSTVPAHQWLWSMADDEAGHFRRYTMETYQDLLAPHFDVQFSSYFFQPLILPIAVLRSLPYRLGIRSSSTDASASREHGTDGGLSAVVLSRLLHPEVPRIAALKSLSFGSSLIIAARRRP